MPEKKNVKRSVPGSAARGLVTLLATLLALAAVTALLISAERIGEGSAPAAAVLICLISSLWGGWTAARNGGLRLPAGLLTGGGAAAVILLTTLLTASPDTSVYTAAECAAAMLAGGVLGACLRAPAKKRRRGRPAGR